MDYSHAAYFAGAPAQAPFHQFPMSITPLTPSHSNSAGSDDFNNTSPPVSPQHQSISCRSPKYLYLMRLFSRARFIPRLPLPCLALQPTLLASGSCWMRGNMSKAYTFLTQDAFDHYQGEHFQNFDQYTAAHFNTQPAPFPGPPTPPSQTQHPVVHNAQSHPAAHHGINGAAPTVKPPPQPNGLAMTKTEPLGDIDGRQGSNSADEEDLTPAQSRRKAQNRAA